MREKKHTACGFMQTLDNEFRGVGTVDGERG
jgi:hypothetical protein